jgi:hypothetical protein
MTSFSKVIGSITSKFHTIVVLQNFICLCNGLWIVSIKQNLNFNVHKNDLI